MIVSLVVAMDQNGGIGHKGKLPWRLPSDLKRFKRITMGHHLIAGRKTFESIGGPLRGRTMIVVSRNPAFQAEGCLIARSLAEALELAADRGEGEVFVIGGAELYAAALPITDRIHLTQVHANVEADVFFPDIEFSGYHILESVGEPGGAGDQYPYTYRLLTKKSLTNGLNYV